MNEEITKQLLRDEGTTLHAYTDTLGFLTIGVGRLIDKRKGGGISEQEAMYLLSNDVEKITSEVRSAIPWYEGLDNARKGVLINMAFQMGVNGLLSFKNTLAMVREGRYARAAETMLLSKWATQTPARAKRLATQMASGKWQ